MKPPDEWGGGDRESGGCLTGWRNGDAVEAEWSLPDLLGHVDTWSARRAFDRALGTDALVQLREDFARETGAAWGDPAVRRAVRWPIAVRAGHLPHD
ncbi:MAG: hypothetical protein ACYC4J_06860 [Gemmatimonadaceae bacterium]